MRIGARTAVAAFVIVLAMGVSCKKTQPQRIRVVDDLEQLYCVGGVIDNGRSRRGACINISSHTPPAESPPGTIGSAQWLPGGSSNDGNYKVLSIVRTGNNKYDLYEQKQLSGSMVGNGTELTVHFGESTFNLTSTPSTYTGCLE